MNIDEVALWIATTATKEDVRTIYAATKSRSQILDMQTLVSFKVGDRVLITRLIAAAPELIAALEAAEWHIEWANAEGCEVLLRRINRAIAAARGEANK